MYQYKWQILDQTNISYFLFWGQHMITETKIEANLYLPLYIYKWDLDLFERLYCCCLDFQPHWLLLTFRPLLAIPACFKSPKRDNCLLVYVVSTLSVYYICISLMLLCMSQFLTEKYFPTLIEIIWPVSESLSPFLYLDFAIYIHLLYIFFNVCSIIAFEIWFSLLSHCLT